MGILVTGGVGFIGGHLIQQLSRFRYRTISVDPRADGTYIESPKAYYCHEYADYELIRHILTTDKKIFAIVHLGAWSTVRHALHSPQFLFQRNVQTTANILQAIEDTPEPYRPNRIIFASSSAVQEPRESYYGISKFTCEEMLKVFERTTGIKTYSLRFANVYGHRQNVKNDVLIATLVEYAYQTWQGERPQLKIFGDGNSIRHYIHVNDVVDAIEYTITNDTLPSVFNVSVSKGNTTNEIVKMGLQACKECFGVDMRTPIHTPPDPNDKDHVTLLPDKALLKAGWYARYPQITAEGIMSAMMWRKTADDNVFSIPHNERGEKL